MRITTSLIQKEAQEALTLFDEVMKVINALYVFLDYGRKWKDKLAHSISPDSKESLAKMEAYFGEKWNMPIEKLDETIMVYRQGLSNLEKSKNLLISILEGEDNPCVINKDLLSTNEFAEKLDKYYQKFDEITQRLATIHFAGEPSKDAGSVENKKKRLDEVIAQLRKDLGHIFLYKGMLKEHKEQVEHIIPNLNRLNVILSKKLRTGSIQEQTVYKQKYLTNLKTLAETKKLLPEFMEEYAKQNTDDFELVRVADIQNSQTGEVAPLMMPKTSAKYQDLVVKLLFEGEIGLPTVDAHLYIKNITGQWHLTFLVTDSFGKLLTDEAVVSLANTDAELDKRITEIYQYAKKVYGANMVNWKIHPYNFEITTEGFPKGVTSQESVMSALQDIQNKYHGTALRSILTSMEEDLKSPGIRSPGSGYNIPFDKAAKYFETTMQTLPTSKFMTQNIITRPIPEGPNLKMPKIPNLPQATKELMNLIKGTGHQEIREIITQQEKPKGLLSGVKKLIK